MLSFLFSSLFLFPGWASNNESFGGFHVNFLGAIGAGVLHVLQLLFFCFSVSCIGFGFRSARGRGWLST